MNRLLCALCACALACGPPPKKSATGFTTRGGFVRDAADRALVLRGANVSNLHKWSPYFDFHQPQDFANLRSTRHSPRRFVPHWQGARRLPGLG